MGIFTYRAIHTSLDLIVRSGFVVRAVAVALLFLPPLGFTSADAASSAQAANKPAKSSLVDIVKAGNLAAARQLLDHGADPNSHDQQGLSALNWAAYDNNLAMADLLIRHGASPNWNANDAKWTPLMNAMGDRRGAHTEVARLLLAHGAQVNLQDSRGWTALDYAARDPKASKFIQSFGGASGLPPLLAAVNRGDTANVQQLLASGADPNSKDPGGSSALELGVNSGSLAIVKILLDHHANPNVAGKYGETPLTRAAMEGYPDIAAYLVVHGAGLNARNSYGQTALDIAKANKHEDIVKILLAHGAVGAPQTAPAQQPNTALQKCQNEKDPDTGISLCTQFINAKGAAGPERAAALATRAFYRYQKNDDAAGMADANAALRLDKNCYDGRLMRAMLYDRQKAYTRAIADYTIVIGLNRSEDIGYLRRGVDYAQTGKFALAAADFRRCLKLKPGEANCRSSLSILQQAAHSKPDDESICRDLDTLARTDKANALAQSTPPSTDELLTPLRTSDTLKLGTASCGVEGESGTVRCLIHDMGIDEIAALGNRCLPGINKSDKSDQRAYFWLNNGTMVKAVRYDRDLNVSFVHD